MRSIAVGFLVSIMLVLASESANAQEYGRGALGGGELGRAPLNRRGTVFHSGKDLAGLAGGTWGTSITLCYADIDWDLGDSSGSESVWCPELSIFYMTAQNFDVRLGLKYAGGEDESSTYGALEAEMLRIVLGSRYWIPTPTRLVPYVGAGLGLYMLDGDQELADNCPAEASVDDGPVPGINLHAGCGYLVSDQFLLTTELSYDTVMSDADAQVHGENEDLSVSVFSFGIGLVYTF